MSPEQARGEEVGRQTDIWAFGCLLFEMLAGRRAFEGETGSDTVAAVLKERPDWEALPPNTPSLVQALLRRCLRRDLSRRLHDIADARIEIEEAMEEPDAVVAARTSPFHSIPGPTGSTASRWLSPVPLTLALVAAALMFFGTSLWLRPSATPPTGRTVFSVELEPGWRLTGGRHEERESYVLQRPTRTAIALSPDGRHLVYAATDGDESNLFLRPMEEEQAVRISGTAGGASPFFSPDGEWIGFFAEESLKKVPIAGGEARKILEYAALPFGAHWGDSDTIVLADGETGSILQVPAAGGESATLTRVATEQGETGHRLPQLLPGGRVLVFTVWKGGQAASNIGVKTIDADEHEILVEGGSDPRVLPTGHLLFVREGTLMAVPFDDEELKLVGEPVPVVEDVMHALYVPNDQMSSGAAQFSVSRSGSLAHATGGVHPGLDYPLAWIDEDGNLERIPTPAGDHIWPRLSPDGRRIGYLKGSGRGDRDVWIYDRRTGTPRRLTHGFDPIGLVWSPDGTRIVISSRVHAGHPNLYMVPLQGNGEPEQLTSTEVRQVPSSWSTDGHLAFVQGTYPAYDIWVLPASGTGFGRPEPFLTGPSTEEAFPAFSPDGDWLAYASDETGERQVYVIPYPGPGTPIQVSREGGRSPAWARDGGQIFYRHRGGSTISKIKMMAVDLEYGDHLTAGSLRLLFEAPFDGTQGVRNYDVAPDGRFLVNLNLDSERDPQPVTHVHVILNWIEELERQVPTAK